MFVDMIANFLYVIRVYFSCPSTNTFFFSSLKNREGRGHLCLREPSYLLSVILEAHHVSEQEAGVFRMKEW